MKFRLISAAAVLALLALLLLGIVRIDICCYGDNCNQKYPRCENP